MSELRGHKVVAGASYTAYLEGVRIAEMTAVTARVIVNREDQQFGWDVDSKAVGYKGDLTYRLKHVYSRGKVHLQNCKSGTDKRYQLVSRTDDRDIAGGQSESVTLNNVWLNEFDIINWERGRADEYEYSGGFTPTDAQYQEAIEATA